MPQKDWSLYIIETECGKLYTGISKDAQKRFQDHKDSPKGAKFLRGFKPKKLVFTQEGLTRSEALKLEIRVKKLTRAQKLALIKSGSLPFS